MRAQNQDARRGGRQDPCPWALRWQRNPSWLFINLQSATVLYVAAACLSFLPSYSGTAKSKTSLLLGNI